MRKGFTLVELVVVIAIIAILASIISPNVFKAIEKAGRSATLGDWQAITSAVVAFEADTGVWPDTGCFDALIANVDPTNCVRDPNGYYGWDGPYIDQWPSRTHWGGNYVFVNDNCIDWEAADASGASTSCGGASSRPDSAFLRVEGTPLATRGLLDIQIDGVVINASCNDTSPNYGRDCGQCRWGPADIADTYLIVATDQSILN